MPPGTWDRLTRRQGRIDKALGLTRQAVFAAQKVNAPESLYLWQWQAGRLLKKTGKEAEATPVIQEQHCHAAVDQG